MKIGFIGAGNMGGALATAVCLTISSENVLLADKNVARAESLANKLSCKAADNATVASECDYLFIGVKPQIIASVLAEIAPILAKRKVAPTLISMAAGVEIAKIGGLLGAEYPIIRIMPNTPVEVGAGMVLYSVNSAVDAEVEAEFLSFMSAAGVLDKIPESLIDAGSALSGCGPAFVYMFIEALADGGVKCGLPRNTALKYAEQTLIGAATLAKLSDKHPETLKDAVCSPGGSTIEGCLALEDGAFRGNVAGAVSAAFEKTRKLGK